MSPPPSFSRVLPPPARLMPWRSTAAAILTVCALLVFWRVYFPERDFIPFLTGGSRPLTPCTCCFKSCPCPFGRLLLQSFGCCVSPIFSVSCTYLSGPLTFCLLLNVGMVLAICVINESSFVKCFGI